jgi:HEPN domain-containing protein
MSERPTDEQVNWPVRGWLEKGEHDLRAAQSLIDDPAPLTDVICFHCQQAAEKYLKGFLANHDIVFARVHDLRYLLNLCIDIDAEFEALHADIDDLNDYAVEPRYPADLPILYPVDEARRAIKLAERVVAFVGDKLPSILRE